MDLRKLSDEALDQNLLSYVRKEKEVLKEVLLHIAEVDRRRLYLKMSYSSLHVYLVERMGYDGGSAQRRIDAARLSHQVPSVIQQIDRGEINLSQVTFLQKSLRQAKGQNTAPGFKADLLEEIKYKTLAQTQSTVCRALNIELKASPKVTHQANESVRLEVTLSKEQWLKLQQMREALSNTLPTADWDQVLEYLADKVIEQKTRVPKLRAAVRTQTEPREQIQSMEQPTNTSKPKNLGLSLKRQVLLRDKCCQYRDLKTGKVCGSKWNLEVDHIKPLWAEGTNTIPNLRVLCANHNKEVYRQQANIRRV